MPCPLVDLQPFFAAVLTRFFFNYLKKKYYNKPKFVLYILSTKYLSYIAVEALVLLCYFPNTLSF